MAAKADFTEDEWKALERGVTGAGMLVSVSDRDFTDSFGEASALAKALVAHRESPSELVRELSGTRGTGFGMTASPQEVESGTIAAIGVALAALARRHRTRRTPTGSSSSTSRTLLPRRRAA